jgi:radical SAM protein with 4Fe4S-binding SPASM domain
MGRGIGCKFIPLCGGGCRLGAISKHNDMNAIACEKEYFENVSTMLVVSEI